MSDITRAIEEANLSVDGLRVLMDKAERFLEADLQKQIDDINLQISKLTTTSLMLQSQLRNDNGKTMG